VRSMGPANLVEVRVRVGGSVSDGFATAILTAAGLGSGRFSCGRVFGSAGKLSISKASSNRNTALL